MGNGKDNLKSLYDNLVADGYDLPNYDQFKTDMTDDVKLNKLYTNLVDAGYDLPEYGVFQSDMGVKKKEPTGDVSATGTEPTPQSPSPYPSVKREAISLTPPVGKIDVQKYAAGGKQPTAEVDVEVQQKREELGVEQPTEEVQTEFVGEEEMPAFPTFEAAQEDLTQIQEQTMTTDELNQMHGFKAPEKVNYEEKFRTSPDGTLTVRGEYYGYNTEDQGSATPNEKLAVMGFYYNKQSDKKGEFDLFKRNPDVLFSEYEPQIVSYLDTLQSTDEKKYNDIKRKINAGNFTQRDQFDLISGIQAKSLKNLQRDINVLSQRIEEGETGYGPMLEDKILQYQGEYAKYTDLYKQYPQLAEQAWKQEVLDKNWVESEGVEAALPWLAVNGAKVNNMLMNTANSTGQFLLRTAGLYNQADAYNQFWDEGILQVPQTPIVENGEINWTNASTEVIPQLAQMYLVFSKGAQGINALAGQSATSNFGLFTAGFMATYKDLYDQAKAADLSDGDANLYATIVGAGVAGAELIMPDRNFFATNADDILRFTTQQAAKGVKGKELQSAITNYIKKVGAENVEEFTQDFVSNASAVVADATIDGAQFNAELFDKDGIISTGVVTTLTAGLAGGGGLIRDIGQRRRDIYTLSQNFENFQEQLNMLVESGEVTPERAQELTKEVEAVRQAETKVPPQMAPEKKAEVVPLVAEKDKLEQEKKELDPVFQPPVQEKIDAINQEIVDKTQPEVVAETEQKPERVAQEERGAETTTATTQEIAIGDDIKFMQGRGEFAKERQGKVTEIREDGSYVAELEIGGEKTTTIVKPENIIQDATEKGKIEQGDFTEREGTDGQEQGKQEDRKDEEKPVEEAKGKTGRSDSLREGGEVTQEKVTPDETIQTTPEVQGTREEGKENVQQTEEAPREVGIQEDGAKGENAGEEAQAKVTPEQEERASSFGYTNIPQAINSVNKNLWKEYALTDFDNIPDAELKEASKISKTVAANAEKKEAIAKVEEQIAAKKAEIARKLRESRGKLQSGIDPSILPDLLELGKLYVEKGIRKADAFIAQMRQDLNELGITDVSDEDIKSEVFEQIFPEKPQEGKTKRTGRSKTVKEGRMPIANEEMRKRVDNSFYQTYGPIKAKDDAENFFAKYDKIDEGNWREVADELKRVDILANPWILVARDIHVANGFYLVDKLQKEGKAEEAEALADSAIDFFNESAKIATRAGQVTGNLNVLRLMDPAQMTLFFTRAMNRAFDSSRVIKRRRKAAKADIELIQEGLKANQRETARKMAEGVKKGNIAPEVKRKARGENPNAYKVKIEQGNKKINDGLKLLRKSASNMTSGGISPEALEGIKLIVEGMIIKGSVNITRIYNNVRNMVNDNLKQDISREEFDKIYEESGLEKLRLEVEKKKLESDKYLKSKVKEEIKAQDILAELTYEYYSGENQGLEGIVSAMQEKLGLTEQEAESIKKRLDTVFEQVLTEENNKLLRNKFRKNKRASGTKLKEAARNFAEYVQAGALDAEYMMAQLQEFYGIDSLNAHDIEKLKELSEKYFRASIFKDEIGTEIADYISDRVPVSSFQLYQGFWYASVLSGVGTQITNIYGNLNLLAGEFAVNKVAEAIGAVVRKDGTIHAPNKQTAKRLISTLDNSMYLTFEVFKNGATSNKYVEERNTQFSKEFTVERLDQYRGGSKIQSTVKKIIRGTYTPVKYILRGLEGFDQGFGNAAFDAEANTLLNQYYKKQGLRGKELQRAVYNDLFGSEAIKEESFEEVIAEMKDLGMNPNDTLKVQKGLINNIRSKMDPEIRREANAFAAKVTLKGTPTGVAGIVAKGISSMNNTIGFTRFIIPFVNVPFNMLNRWIDWVPAYGLARAYGIGVSSIWERKTPDMFTRLGVVPSKAANKREMQQAWARQILSATLAGAVYALTQMTYTDDDGEEKPILEFSGGRAYLDFKAKTDAEKYMPEYSVRFMGGTPFSYKLAPLAPIFLFFGESRDRDIFKEDKPFEREWTDKSILYGTMMTKFFVDAAPLQGLEQLWESIDRFATSKEQESDKFMALVGKQLVKQGTTVIEPNLYGQAIRIFDPKSYSPQDLSDMVFKGLNISFLNEEATYYFDGFGRAIKYYPAERYFPVQHIFQGKGDDRVDLLMAKNSIYPSDILGRTIPYKTEIIEYGGRGYNPKSFKEKFTEAYDLQGLEGLSKGKYVDALKDMQNELPEFAFISTKQWQDMSVEVGKRVYKEIDSRYNELKNMESKELEDEVRQMYKIHFEDYVSENFDKIKRESK